MQQGHSLYESARGKISLGYFMKSNAYDVILVPLRMYRITTLLSPSDSYD